MNLNLIIKEKHLVWCVIFLIFISKSVLKHLYENQYISKFVNNVNVNSNKKRHYVEISLEKKYEGKC